MAKKPKWDTNFDQLFDEQLAPVPTTEKVFNAAAQNLGDEALETIYELMNSTESEGYVKLACAKVLLAYARGTPIKKSEVLVGTPQIRPIILTDIEEQDGE